MNNAIPNAEPMEILLRTYVERVEDSRAPFSRSGRDIRIQNPEPSEYALIFDCETTSDAVQRLRFGAYQVRRRDALVEAGLFFASDLPAEEIQLLEAYASDHRLKIRTLAEFIEGSSTASVIAFEP